MDNIILHHLNPGIKDYYLLYDENVYTIETRETLQLLHMGKYTFCKDHKDKREYIRINNFDMTLSFSHQYISINFVKNNFIEYTFKFLSGSISDIFLDVYNEPIIKNMDLGNDIGIYENGEKRSISYNKEGFITSFSYSKGYKFVKIFIDSKVDGDIYYTDSKSRKISFYCNKTNDYELENYYLDLANSPQLIELVKIEIEHILADPLQYDFRRLYRINKK